MNYVYPKPVMFYVGEPWNNSKLVKKLLKLANLARKSGYSQRAMTVFFIKLTNEMLHCQKTLEDAQVAYEQHIVPFIAHAVTSVVNNRAQRSTPSVRVTFQISRSGRHL